MGSSLHLTLDLYGSLLSHAAEEYPYECCGILLGRRVGADGHVRRAIRVPNRAEGDRRKTYQMDWTTLFHVLRSARDGPEEIVGFYHSHPDGSSTPSRLDREFAWVDYVYLIVNMRDGKSTGVTGWRVPSEELPFAPHFVCMDDEL